VSISKFPDEPVLNVVLAASIEMPPLPPEDMNIAPGVVPCADNVCPVKSIVPVATMDTGPASPPGPLLSVVMLPPIVMFVVEVFGDEFTSITNPPLLTPCVLIELVVKVAEVVEFPVDAKSCPPLPLVPCRSTAPRAMPAVESKVKSPPEEPVEVIDPVGLLPPPLIAPLIACIAIMPPWPVPMPLLVIAPGSVMLDAWIKIDAPDAPEAAALPVIVLLADETVNAPVDTRCIGPVDVRLAPIVVAPPDTILSPVAEVKFPPVETAPATSVPGTK
jgi:hypothetical protein